MVEIVQGDCLRIMPDLAENSFDAIVTDPPYFRVKGEAWDRQWDHEPDFLSWLEQVARHWFRLLKPNGSLYVFAAPGRAAQVEVTLGKFFHVLNHIVWVKEEGWHKKQDKETLRAFFPQTERILFAEHNNADNRAKGVSGWGAACDDLRGFVFEPLRAYLAGEFQRAGVPFEQANEFCGTVSMAAGHYFSKSQWCLPTAEHYAALQRGLNAGRNGSGPEYLRADYEDLRADYEDLRRPFSVSPDVPYTDVWTFPTVSSYPGKHPCEKPVPLLEHIITTSTRPGARVLDSFLGTGATAVACAHLGRDCVGLEREEEYCRIARARVAYWTGSSPVRTRTEPAPRREPARPPPGQLSLFEEIPC